MGRMNQRFPLIIQRGQVSGRVLVLHVRDHWTRNIATYSAAFTPQKPSWQYLPKSHTGCRHVEVHQLDLDSTAAKLPRLRRFEIHMPGSGLGIKSK